MTEIINSLDPMRAFYFGLWVGPMVFGAGYILGRYIAGRIE